MCPRSVKNKTYQMTRVLRPGAYVVVYQPVCQYSDPWLGCFWIWVIRCLYQAHICPSVEMGVNAWSNYQGRTYHGVIGFIFCEGRFRQLAGVRLYECGDISIHAHLVYGLLHRSAGIFDLHGEILLESFKEGMSATATTSFILS